MDPDDDHDAVVGVKLILVFEKNPIGWRHQSCFFGFRVSGLWDFELKEDCY